MIHVPTQYGVTLNGIGNTFNTDRLTNMADLSMTWLRPLLYWSAIELKPGVFDWPKLDSIMEPCAKAGVKVDFAIQHVPSFHVSGTRGDGAPIIDPNGALLFVQALCARYGSSALGSIEALNEGGDDAHVEKYRVPDEMVKLLKVIYPWVKQNYPHILVGAGAELEGHIDHIKAWGTRFYVLGGGPLCDYRNFHFYTPKRAPDNNGGSSNDATFEAFWQTMALIDTANGHATKPIWCTEVGWPAGPNTGTVTPQQQADYLQKVILSVQGSQGKVANLLVYTLAPNDGFSLVVKDGSGQIALTPAYTMWQKAVATQPPTPVPTTVPVE